jgi:hypothetical protein
VDPSSFVDLKKLLREGENIHTLDELCVDEILLRWMNLMINENREQDEQQLTKLGGNITVHNFSEDMKVRSLNQLYCEMDISQKHYFQSCRSLYVLLGLKGNRRSHILHN